MSVNPPSSVVTVIITSPSLQAVTIPVASTLATSSLLVEYITFLFVAFPGVITGTNLTVFPTYNNTSSSIDIPDTSNSVTVGSI